MHDQGEQNYDAVTAALHYSLHEFLPGSATRLPQPSQEAPFGLDHFVASSA